MLDLREYQRRPAGLCDFLPWAALVASGVVLNKDGSFQRTAGFRGPDLDSATEVETGVAAARLNSALRRLGSGWAVFVEARRDPSDGYPASAFADPVSALVDEERKASFAADGDHFESRYFLTLLYQPPVERAGRLEAAFIEGRSGRGLDWRAELAGFVDRTDRLLGLLEALMPQVAWLDDAATLSFLHGAVTTTRQQVAAPETPMQLDALLATQGLVGGLEPQLGGAHLRVLTLTGFPVATAPGLLDELNRLPITYRWTTRAICLDKTAANGVLAKIRRQWFAKRKSVLALLREALTQEPSALVDNDAANKAAEADQALQDLGGDAVAYAYVTASLVVWDEDPVRADAKLALAEKVIQGRDLTVMRERANAVEAWLGTLPGHVYANVRQPLLSTLNLVHLAPVSAVWAGSERNVHLDGPPLLMATAAGSTPFRLSLHVGDVGHSLVVGPARSGQPDQAAGGSHRQALDQVVAGAEPDRADIGVAVAKTHQQGGGDQIGQRAHQAEHGDDLAGGGGPTPGAPDRDGGDR
jgi:type IV secretory pathway VirB4 component